MAHIFLSYSHEDKHYTDQLFAWLERRGFNTWMDKRINAGADWSTDIEKYLDTATVLILIMSSNSKKSLWVKNELTRAQRLNIPILPLLLEGSGPFLAVEAIQYEDVRDGKLPNETFFERLEKYVPRIDQEKPQRSETGHFLYYSVQPEIIDLIHREYYSSVPVICTEEFDPQSFNSPLRSWRILNHIAVTGDLSDPLCAQIKNLILDVADYKRKAGEISSHQFDNICNIVRQLKPNFYRPIIYLISRTSIGSERLVRLRGAGGIVLDEYKITDLRFSEFEAIRMPIAF